MNDAPKAYKVKVGEVIGGGRHNVPYVVTWPTDATTRAELGSITVEVSSDVWEGKSPPKKGEFLVISDVREKPAGWNAHSARYFRPEDRANPDIVQ